MSYRRVIPRDLFNEANLLKCLGRLSILLEMVRGQPARFEVDSVEDFRITQDESDGSIFAAALPFVIDDKHYHLSRPLNSRNPWPLYCARGDGVWQVFDDDGALTQEFSDLLMVKERGPSVNRASVGSDGKLLADMAALLAELIDIEGPCPGNAAWAAKVRAMLDRVG